MIYFPKESNNIFNSVYVRELNPDDIDNTIEKATDRIRTKAINCGLPYTFVNKENMTLVQYQSPYDPTALILQQENNILHNSLENYLELCKIDQKKKN